MQMGTMDQSSNSVEMPLFTKSSIVRRHNFKVRSLIPVEHCDCCPGRSLLEKAKKPSTTPNGLNKHSMKKEFMPTKAKS